MTDAKPAEPRWIRLVTGLPGAAVLLAACWILMLASLWEKSLTTDEIVHVTAGYSYWHYNDYRLDPENGNLPQRLMAFPLLYGPYAFPTRELPAWRSADEWGVGDAWFYRMGHDAVAMLRRGRATSGLMAVALGALVWAWARRLFGPWGGLLSLVLFVLSPSFLANGALMTSDTACALFFLAATGGIWSMLHRLTPGRVAASGLLVGCLFVTKMSAILILPIAAVLLVARLLGRRPLPVSCGSWRRELAGPGRQLLAFLAAGVAQVLLVVAVIWASFGFRYSAFAAAQPGWDHFRDSWEHVLGMPGPIEVLEQLKLQPDQRHATQALLLTSGVRTDAWTPEAAKALQEIRHLVLKPDQVLRLDAVQAAPPPAGAPRLFLTLRDHRLLPEAYIFGYATTWKYSQARGAFLNGKFSLTGWKTFFPYTFLVKTPLPFFGVLLLAAGLGAAWCRGLRLRPASRSFAVAYATLPLWVLLAVYWAAVIPSHVDIGHRHILATYPPLFILAGAVARWAARSRNRAAGAAVLALVALQAGEMAYRFPNYIAYFNSLDGGPGQAYRHLVDSSLDWGQDLPGVGKYVESHHLTGRIYLGYFGAGSPEYYGTPAQLLYPRTQPMLAWSFPVAQANRLIAEITRSHPYYGVVFAASHEGVENITLLQRPAALVLRGGTYFISATLLQPLEYNSPGPWGPWNDRYETEYQRVAGIVKPLLEDDPVVRKATLRSRPLVEWARTLDDFDAFRFGRLTAYLRRREPDDTVNFSILVYHLTDADLARALTGPPPERGPDVLREMETRARP